MYIFEENNFRKEPANEIYFCEFLFMHFWLTHKFYLNVHGTFELSIQCNVNTRPSINKCKNKYLLNIETGTKCFIQQSFSLYALYFSSLDIYQK